jgi:hypothetical protein
VGIVIAGGCTAAVEIGVEITVGTTAGVVGVGTGVAHAANRPHTIINHAANLRRETPKMTRKSSPLGGGDEGAITLKVEISDLNY